MTNKAAAAASGLTAAVLAIALPAPAVAFPTVVTAVRAPQAAHATLVQSPGNSLRYDTRSRESEPRVGPVGPDNVGSLGYDGRGYGYNRYSGQVYQSCMEDLGYGRVRPCDAGGR
jgi:hypothetical protein